VLAHIRDAVGNPLHMLLDRNRHVPSTDGLLGPVIVNRLGKPATASPR
jgi:hypothetical protein